MGLSDARERAKKFAVKDALKEGGRTKLNERPKKPAVRDVLKEGGGRKSDDGNDSLMRTINNFSFKQQTFTRKHGNSDLMRMINNLSLGESGLLGSEPIRKDFKNPEKHRVFRFLNPTPTPT